MIVALILFAVLALVCLIWLDRRLRELERLLDDEDENGSRL